MTSVFPFICGSRGNFTLKLSRYFSGGGLLDLSNLGDSELQSLLNNMNQQQLMNLFGGSLGGSGGGSGGMGELAALLGQSGRQRSHARAAAAAAATSSSSTTSSSSSATRSTPAPSATTAGSAAATTASATTTPASASSATATAGSSGANIQLSDLQNILSGLGTPGGSQAAASGPPVDLAAGLTAEAMRPLLSNPDFVKRMKELLPAEHQGAADVGEEISSTVSSPQFQQALSLFSSAFQSAQLAPLIREFDLGDEAVAAATAGDMEAFVKALQKKSKDDGKKDEPEDMALD